ncbi:MAG: hypothetical protein QM764_06035 [Chitinophagaceae bacterium]
MNTRTLLAALFAGATALLLGWFILEILVMNYSAGSEAYSAFTATPPEMGAIAIANIAWGIMYALIFSISNAKTGVRRRFSTALTLTLLMVLGFNLFMYSQMNLSTTGISAFDVILNALIGGATGTALGWRVAKAVRNQ